MLAGQQTGTEPLPVTEQPQPPTEERPLISESPIIIEQPTEPPLSEEPRSIPKPAPPEPEHTPESKTPYIENDSREDESGITGIADSIPPQGGGGVSVPSIAVFAVLSFFGITVVFVRFNPVRHLLKVFHLL